MARTRLEREIAGLIGADGPMPLSRFMGLCLGHPRDGYYMTRDPFGSKGDFITAPEVSQMFGEMIGVWAMSQWQQMGKPSAFHLIELGPGRGTLMMDLLRASRAMPDFRQAARVSLVEMSPLLQSAQKRSLQDAGVDIHWAGHIDEVPEGPSLIIANEFFDALPIMQLQRTEDGFFERAIGLDAQGGLCFGLMPLGIAPPGFAKHAKPGDIVELSPASAQYAQAIAQRLIAHDGAGLIIDYGHGQSTIGDTLQAIRAHEKVSVLDRPGESDITAHVDFEALGQAFVGAGVQISDVITQQDLLARLGLHTRAQMLAANASARQRADLVAAVARLAGPQQMGHLFKAMAVYAPGMASPAAFNQEVTG